MFDFTYESVMSMLVYSEPDTMTLAEAIQQPYRHKFIKSMEKELRYQIDHKHWKVIPLLSITSGKHAITMLWLMKRKRDPLGKFFKWKARLFAGGHRSIEYVDYWYTYLPVVSWSTVQTMIVFAILNGWNMESIDFVLIFPQAPIKTDIYMKPPKVTSGFSIPDLSAFFDKFLKVYKLLMNLYGLKDDGKTWFYFSKEGLLERHWEKPEIDSCLFTKKGILLVV